MEAEKHSKLAEGFLASPVLNGEAPKDVETRSKLVLGTLAGLALGVPASLVLVVATPNALAGLASLLIAAVWLGLKLWPRPVPAAAQRRNSAAFFGAAATTAFPFLFWLLFSKWLVSLWPIFRFSPH